MCILLYVKLIWCSGIPYIYGQLELRVHLPSVYVHSAICETFWCSGIPYLYGQLERGNICHKYMCILLYVKLIWCSGIT